MVFKRFNARPKATTTTTTRTTPAPLVFVNLVLRFCQFVLGITVIGLYAQNIHDARRSMAEVQSKWTFAVVVGALSAVTVMVYVLPRVKSYLAFGWDLSLFILWVAVFGVFGNIYIKQDGRGNTGIRRMKNAVWIDLVNMLLWLVTTLLAMAAFFSLRKKRTVVTAA